MTKKDISYPSGPPVLRRSERAAKAVEALYREFPDHPWFGPNPKKIKPNDEEAAE